MDSTFHLEPLAESETSSPQNDLSQLSSFQMPQLAQQQSTYQPPMLSSPVQNTTFQQASYSQYPYQADLTQHTTPLAGHSNPPVLHQQTAQPTEAMFQMPTQPQMFSQNQYRNTSPALQSVQRNINMATVQQPPGTYIPTSPYHLPPFNSQSQPPQDAQIRPQTNAKKHKLFMIPDDIISRKSHCFGRIGSG